MLTRHRAVALFSAAVVFSATLVAQQPDQQQPTQKFSDEERREIQGINKLLEGVAAGQPAQDDLALTWVRSDLLKAQSSLQYVPFIVTVDPSRLTDREVYVYWRLVSKAAPAPAPAPADPKAEAAKEGATPPAYEYEYLMSSTLPGQAGPAAISRSFIAKPGDYDLYVVVKEPTSTERNAPPAKTSVLRKELTVPDLWNNELNTSSVIMSERVEPLAAPLSQQQQLERPYALGGREIVPSLNMTFGKQSEMTMFVLIYNPTADGGNKPDVTVEYNFYAKAADGEKFFNKTQPQRLNASSLEPEFNLSLGHQLPSGQTIPASVFPPGEYRLEIKITDNLASKSVTRDVNFTVAGA